VFIIDIYTKVIIGYNASVNLRVQGNLKALDQALKTCKGMSIEGLIHHSDRGSQYVDHHYIQRLRDQGIWISMGQTAQQNAYVERLNGIIKNEFLNKWTIKNFKELKIKVKKAVDYYNESRIHRHLPGKLTPRKFESIELNLNYQTRPKVIVYTDGNKKLKATSRSLELYPEPEPKALVCPMVYC
jgi:transposase InsO family protein